MFVLRSYMINAACTFIFIPNKSPLCSTIKMHARFPLNVHTLLFSPYACSECLFYASLPTDASRLHCC